MKYRGIEIRRKTTGDNYDEILYPVTKLSNVIYKESNISNEYITAEEEIVSIYNILKDTKIQSLSTYICDTKDQTIIPIHNQNYTYLDSELEVYYNGLLLIKNHHYTLSSDNTIRLINFSLKVNDEIVYKVLNTNKVNLQIDYEKIDEAKGKELKDIVNSINEYINLVNTGKKLLSDEFKKGNIQVNWNDSFDEFALQLKKLIETKKTTPTDLGNLFSKPFYEVNVGFILGDLYGVENDKSIFADNLGLLF